jgi:hypothetical protein
MTEQNVTRPDPRVPAHHVHRFLVDGSCAGGHGCLAIGEPIHRQRDTGRLLHTAPRCDRHDALRYPPPGCADCAALAAETAQFSCPVHGLIQPCAACAYMADVHPESETSK